MPFASCSLLNSFEDLPQVTLHLSAGAFSTTSVKRFRSSLNGINSMMPEVALVDFGSPEKQNGYRELSISTLPPSHDNTLCPCVGRRLVRAKIDRDLADIAVATERLEKRVGHHQVPVGVRMHAVAAAHVVFLAVLRLGFCHRVDHRRVDVGKCDAVASATSRAMSRNSPSVLL